MYSNTFCQARPRRAAGESMRSALVLAGLVLGELGALSALICGAGAGFWLLLGLL